MLLSEDTDFFEQEVRGKKSTLNILNLNIRSIRDKIEQLENILEEHWVTRTNMERLVLRSFRIGAQYSRPEGYAGVVILYREGLKLEQLKCVELHSEEGQVELAGVFVKSENVVMSLLEFIDHLVDPLKGS